VTQIVRLRGIRADGRHGASAGETDQPQPFEVDLEVEVDAAADDLDATADYRRIVAAARGTIEGAPVTLIETLAARIAAVVGDIPGVRSCRAVVRKPRAAERLGIDDVSAETAE
jgi:dihydroneopterin aldolase